MVLLRRAALRPLEQLTAVTRRIAAGDYAERADIRAVSELEQVAGAFNEMAEAIEADVAARERAERDAVEARLTAEHASRAKSTFLAAMSHEIRTPMIGVTGMLEVLAQTELTAQQRHMVAPPRAPPSRCCRSSATSSTSRRSRPAGWRSPDDVRAAAADGIAVDTFVHTASAKGLLLTWSADERLAAAHVGDPLRIRQIITNFLSNAVKFTEVGGIEVAVRVVDESGEAQTVEIAVTDTGVGVPVEHQQRLFAEFAQAEAVHRAAVRRHRPRAGDLQAPRRADGRRRDDGERARRRDDDAPDRAAADRRPGRGRPGPELHPGAPPTTRPKPSREQAEREGSLLLLAEDHPVNRTVLTHQLDLARLPRRHGASTGRRRSSASSAAATRWSSPT